MVAQNAHLGLDWDGIAGVELEVLLEHKLAEVSTAVRVEKALVLVVGDAAAVVYLSDTLA